jgi:hypothetical protein
VAEEGNGTRQREAVRPGGAKPHAGRGGGRLREGVTKEGGMRRREAVRLPRREAARLRQSSPAPTPNLTRDRGRGRRSAADGDSEAAVE